MGAHTAKRRLAPQFSHEEINTIDRQRGSASRAGYLRQRIGVLVGQSPRVRDRLGQVKLADLPSSGAPRVDIRMNAALFEQFDGWLGGLITPGAALRAALHLENAVAAHEGSSTRATSPTPTVRPPRPNPRKRMDRARSRSAPKPILRKEPSAADPPRATATCGRPPAGQAHSVPKLRQPTPTPRRSAPASVTPPTTPNLIPNSFLRSQPVDAPRVHDRRDHHEETPAMSKNTPRKSNSSRLDREIDAIAARIRRTRRYSFGELEPQVWVEVEAATIREADQLVEDIEDGVEGILLARAWTAAVQLDLAGLIADSPVGTETRFILGAWVDHGVEEDEDGGQDDEDDEDEADWDDVEDGSLDDDRDENDDDVDDDDVDDDDVEIRWVGVRDPGGVADQAARLIKRVGRDGDFQVRTHLNAETDEGAVHLVEVVGFVG